jgi:hypothetical protein
MSLLWWYAASPPNIKKGRRIYSLGGSVSVSNVRTINSGGGMRKKYPSGEL